MLAKANIDLSEMQTVQLLTYFIINHCCQIKTAHVTAYEL